MLRRKLAIVGALAVAAVLSAPRSASATIFTTQQTLDTLYQTGNALQSGDKLFNFAPYVNAFSNVNGPTASNIFVQPIFLSGDFGIRFISTWTSSNSTLVDTGLDFDVSVVDDPSTPGIDESQVYKIHDSTLSVAGAANGTGTFFVTETVTDPNNGGATLANKLANQNSTSDHKEFPYLVSIAHVKKDIQALGGTDGTASISHVDQLFSQSGGSVPEPVTASLALAGLAALGLSATRRRHA
jgi:hypothetical protein